MPGPLVTLVLGGAGSGKSEVAEGLAADLASPLGPVTYVATGVAVDGDADWAARIRRHRERRPASWRTVEVAAGEDLGAALEVMDEPVLVDSLGTWVAGHPAFTVDVDAFVAALGRRRAPSIVVSDEVGWGVHPATGAGRDFRDALARLNRAVAAAAGTVLLVVAGRVLPLP